MIKKTDDSVLVVKRTMQILEELLKTSRALGVNEIARLLKFQPSTTHRILKTLESEKWVYQDSEQKYHFGNKLNYYSKDDKYVILKDVSYYVMQRMTKQERQAMNLIIRTYDKITILQQTRTDRVVDFVVPVSTILPIHASAGGKVMLSFAPKTEREEILNSLDFAVYTPNTISNMESFLIELETIINQGYAIDYKESTEYSCCVAVPVFANDGSVLAALSFSGILGMDKKEDLKYYIPLLQTASKEISAKIAF